MIIRSQGSGVSKTGKSSTATSVQDGGALFHMSENSLNLCLLGASVGGMTLGWFIRNFEVSSRLLQFMGFPAELYMRMLECLVIPVVASSIIAALGSIDIVLAGHIGLIAMLYFVVATGTASAIGIGVGLALGPATKACWNRRRLVHVDGFLDFLRNLVPDNYVEACFYTTATVGKNLTDEDNFETVKEPRINILGLLSVSVMVGCILSVTVNECDVLLNLFVGLSNATVTVSHLASWYSPVGVFFLVATGLTQAPHLDRVFSSIRAFLVVTLVGLAAYGLVLLPGLYAIVTRQDPRRFLRITFSPALKAFRSASRTVSVPDTIEALEEVAGLEPRIVRFVIPVGANVSMSGTALVASAAAVVLAELDGLEQRAEEMLIIGVTVVLASLGAASIPNSGVLTLLMILMALEVSNRDISLVFVLDWMADRFRTTVNIYTDSVGSAIVQHFSRLDPIEDSLDESVVSSDRPGPRLPPGSRPEVKGEFPDESRVEQHAAVRKWSEARRLTPTPSPADRSPGRQPSVTWSDQRRMSSSSDPYIAAAQLFASLADSPVAAGSKRPSYSFDVTPWPGSPVEARSAAVTSGTFSIEVASPEPPALSADRQEEVPTEVTPRSDVSSPATTSRSSSHRRRDMTATSESTQKTSSSSPKDRKSRRRSKSRRRRSKRKSSAMGTPGTVSPGSAAYRSNGAVSVEDTETPSPRPV